jgi:ketosteroid isomerase-like protein
MKIWIAAAAIALALTAPALAQTREDVIAAIETNIGDPDRVIAAIEDIQAAVARDDAETVATWILYPFTVMVDGEEYEFAGPAGFVEHYESMMTPEIKSAIVDQKVEDLFVNSTGIMFGDGQMWLAGVCTDDVCTDFEVLIITIQSTAQ